MRRAQIVAKIGRKILLDTGFSINVLVFESIAAARNPMLRKFNV
jgi:hypothetical protein